MAHVFISYSRKNADFAIELVRECAKHGIDTWLDTQGLNVGDQWRKEINDAIESAFAVVVVMSSTAITSQYVTYEWAYALGLGKKVLPIRLEDVALHPILEELHHLNFTEGKRDWDGLFVQLDQISGDDSSGRIVVDRSAPPAVKDAVRKFDQASPDGWEEAIRTLIAYGGSHETALDALQSALQHPVESVCYDAACALLEIGSEKALNRLTLSKYTPLLQKVAERHSRLGFQVQALKVIGDIGSTETINLLIASLENRSIQIYAARILGELKSREALPSLLSMASNTLNSDESRADAIYALGNIGDPSIIRDIMRFAERGYSRRMSAAAEKAIKQIASEHPTPETLFAVYAHPEDFEQRETSKERLLELGDFAIAVLEQFLRESHYESTARFLLEAIGTKKAKEALERYRGY